MAIPGNLTPITVTATYLLANGTPATGTVEFVLTAPAADPGAPALVPMAPVTVTLDGAGHLSVVLPATDDPDWSATGLVYRVGERITGIPVRYWYAQVPAASPGGTLDLAAVAPAVPQTPFVSYILASQRGAANGVASLDSGGQVPLSQLGNAPSGGGGTPSGTVVSETAYGQSATAGGAATYSRGDHTHGTPALTAVAPTTSAVGDAAAAGTGTTNARVDHVHGREALGGVPTSSAPGDAGAAGTGTTNARVDHKHAREAAATTFTDMASLVGVTLGTVHAGWRNEPGNVTRLKGGIVCSAGGVLANTTFATLPAGSLPAEAQSFSSRTGVSGPANVFVNIDTAGNISCSAALVSTETLTFDGLTFVHA